MGEAQLISFPNDNLLAAAAAENWLSAIVAAQQAGRNFLVALSGGRITKKLFASVVAQAGQRKLSLDSVDFFWADERCVPPDDPESNFRLADENLFRPGNIGSGGIHRIRGELPPAEAVRKATADLTTAAGVEAGAMPVFDVVLLGMGEDGHVASLFPGDAVTSQDRSSIFIAVGNSPKPPPNRVTLGHAPVSAAREVWVLATGQGKEAALRESISTSGHTPLAQVIRSRAVTKIFTDIACERTPKISAAGL